MGQIKTLPAAKLIIGCIYNNSFIKDKAIASLKGRYGAIDFISPAIDFDYTDYYYQEMGRPLKRIFISFKRLVRQERLAQIKLYTNKLEQRFSKQRKRGINIDPGILTLAKLILATTKDNVHRMYLGKGIFAEITLHYEQGGFKPWSWTYPDYQTIRYREIFNTIRGLYQEQVKEKHGSSLPKSI